MRLAEEEKLRKEMSAKKAKEEAERKHQVSGGCPSAGMSVHGSPAFTGHWQSGSVLDSLLHVCSGGALAQDRGGRLWLRRVCALRSTFSSWETSLRKSPSRGHSTQHGPQPHV